MDAEKATTILAVDQIKPEARFDKKRAKSKLWNIMQLKFLKEIEEGIIRAATDTVSSFKLPLK